MTLTRRHTLSLLGGAALLAAPALSRATPRPIRIATEGAFPPYNTLDAKGDLDGFEIELGNAICADQGIGAIWLITNWSDMIPQLLAGDFDVIMAGMGITPSRAARISFGTEYFPPDSQPTGLFVGTHTFQDPRAGVIAVQQSTIHEEHLRMTGARVLCFETAGKALEAVLSGTADTAFGNPAFLEEQLQHIRRGLTILGAEPIQAGGAAAAFRREDTALRARFDAGLAALRADGRLETLRRRWFEPSSTA